MWLGITEYLFRNPVLLDEVIDTAIEDVSFRADDLEFTFAARVSYSGRLTFSLANHPTRIGVPGLVSATWKAITRNSKRFRGTSRRGFPKPQE